MYFLREYVSGSMGVDAMVLSLFHLMDSTHKLSLLDDIRSIIAAQDIARYDSLTSGMKTEWMMSPAKLFAGISPSTADLGLDAISNYSLGFSHTPVTPPLPLTNSLSATHASNSALKSAMKSPGVSMSFSSLDNVQSVQNSTLLSVPSLMSISSQPGFVNANNHISGENFFRITNSVVLDVITNSPHFAKSLRTEFQEFAQNKAYQIYRRRPRGDLFTSICYLIRTTNI